MRVVAAAAAAAFALLLASRICMYISIYICIP
jgi:hypothetical protein